jgi:glycosyltransferase involved in cell wall biosynthesis
VTKHALISVIIPTHNRWPKLCEAIESVLSQTWPSIECVVVDDFSTDGTEVGIRQRFGDKLVYIKNSPNKEKSFSRNRGAMAANGEYVCFLDSDDLLTPNSIAARMAEFTAGFTGVVYGVTRRPGETSQVALEKFSPLDSHSYTVEDYLEKPGLLHNNAYLLSRQDFLDSGMYTEQLTNMEDVNLFIRLLCSHPVKLVKEVVNIMQASEGSARRAYEKIIAQYPRFSETLIDNKSVRNRLDDAQLNQLCCLENQEYLAALYHSGQFEEYVKQYRRLSSENQHQMPIGGRFKKRFWLSRLRAGKFIKR